MKKSKLFKFPKKIILFGDEYSISFEKDKNMIYKTKKGITGSRNCAFIDYKKKIIVLNDWLEAWREKTIWHELAHRFFRYYNLKDEESLCESFANFVINCSKQLGYKK